MTTFTCSDTRKKFRIGDEYVADRFQGQTITLPVENVTDAARAFAGIVARRLYGKRGYCHHVRADSWTRDGRVHNFEAFVGVPADGGGTNGRNIWLSVYAQ